jgi:hypothetical protein
LLVSKPAVTTFRVQHCNSISLGVRLQHFTFSTYVIATILVRMYQQEQERRLGEYIYYPNNFVAGLEGRSSLLGLLHGV